MTSLSDILKKNGLVITLVLLYIIADMVLTYREIYLLNLLPVILIVVYLAVARIDLVYFIIIGCTPLSIQLLEFFPSLSIDFAIPTEPLIFGVLILLTYRAAKSGIVNKDVFNHPVSYAIFFYLFWILVTSITSSIPQVSFKFLLARIWFLAVFYFLAIYILKDLKKIRTFILAYTLPMLIVIFYAINRHLAYGLFDKQASHGVMNPFFRDHTSYGAVLAMLFFAVAGLVLNKKRNFLMQSIVWGSWLIVIIALVLSYTRAAWISVVVSLGILVVVLMRIRLIYILLLSIFGIFYLTGERLNIIHKMQQNRQVSSASLSEHVRSISNITTDASNLERLNRWNSAFRMFRERPVFGFGPGTYMFKYAPYQRSADKTTISTDFGDRGNAHSEYIGPLVESGVLGSLSYIIICIMTLITGINVYFRLKDPRLKQIVLALWLGYITYLIHGTLNNFLDTDKVSALFWGFTAVFVSLDIRLKELNA
ncbi:MAG TPA: O-antigen ligase family protein [Bacteroidales bacterium]|nr:O-antigen ligase family protein [Bacteroidales bacterium]